MNGPLLLLFSAAMLAVLTACAAFSEPAAESAAVALRPTEEHECLGEQDCAVMLLRRQVRSLASVSGDARRRNASQTCAASQALAEGSAGPTRAVERAALTPKALAWLVRAGNDCAAPVPPFTRLYAPWSAVHGGQHASSWNYFRRAVHTVHARVEALTGAALHHHESGVVVGTPGFEASPQCDSEYFDPETGRFEAQLTTRHRHYAALLCLSPPEDHPVHLRYCDGRSVHLTAGTLAVHACGGRNCWSLDRVPAGRLYLLACWFTRAPRHGVPLPAARPRKAKRRGTAGRSSWREVSVIPG